MSSRRMLVAAALLAASALVGAAAQFPAGWKVEEEEARSRVLDAVVGGYPDTWFFKAGWTATAPAARAALLQASLEWTKAVTGSPAFLAAYAQRREESKPQPPTYEKTIEQEMADDRAEQKRSLAESRASLKLMPPDQQKAMAEMLKAMEQQQAQFAADQQMQAAIRQGKQAERASAQQSYETAMASWKQDFPADPKPLIAKRLRAFLEACGDVDFAAKLFHDPQSDKMKFADTRYEMKPAEWKMCYRAGKAPVDAARAFAQAWLKELPPR